MTTVFDPRINGMGPAVHRVVPDATPEAPRDVDHVTCRTPTLSDAVPEIVSESA